MTPQQRMMKKKQMQVRRDLSVHRIIPPPTIAAQHDYSVQGCQRPSSSQIALWSDPGSGQNCSYREKQQDSGTIK